MGKQGTGKVVRAEQANPLSDVWDKLAGRKITGMRVSKRGYANRLEGVQFVLDEGDAEGWCRIMVGRRAEFWHFAAPTID